MTHTDDAELNPEQLRILHLEDNQQDAELVTRALRNAGFSAPVMVVQTKEDFERQLQAGPPDVVLADYRLPQWKGIEAVEVLGREALDIPLILVTGALGEVEAVECIKRGATDYVLKDGLARLPQAIRRALQEKRQIRSRRLAEERLARKVEELARSNADLEQFAYVASHDLQEPLRMVASYTQLLGERYRGKLDENADKYIAYACEGAQRMSTLIQDLLTFSRVARKGSTPAPVDCNDALEDALQNLQTAIEQSGAVVTHDTLPVVLGDSSQMMQLFQNLIGNAIKFQAGDHPPAISVSAENVGREWLFTVSDNGIGIASENLESIFAVFQRLHTRTEYAGNGIGLAVCKKIVERHGGRIWAEARAAQAVAASASAEHGSSVAQAGNIPIAAGSTFKFTLPCAAGSSDVDGREHP